MFGVFFCFFYIYRDEILSKWLDRYNKKNKQLQIKNYKTIKKVYMNLSKTNLVCYFECIQRIIDR